MKWFLYFSFLAVLNDSCVQKSKANEVKLTEGTSIDSFRRMVSFPYFIKRVHWSVKTHENQAGRNIPGPSDWLLLAEINGDSLEIRSIKDSLENGNGVMSREMYVDSNFKKNWLSARLKGLFYGKESHLLLKSNIYKVDKKIFPLILNHGWFTIVDDDIIFLVISST